MSSPQAKRIGLPGALLQNRRMMANASDSNKFLVASIRELLLCSFHASGIGGELTGLLEFRL